MSRRALHAAREFLKIASLESDGSFVQSTPRPREFEYTFYGEVFDLNELESKAFHVEKHEQWLVPVETESKAKLRIRRIDDKRCIVTTKYKAPGMKGCEEVECDIDPGMFEHLKLMGTGGYLKKRYKIKGPGDLVWEIDVFSSNAGRPHTWVKVDLEIPTPDVKPPKELPIKFKTFIEHQGPDLTAEERALIDQLWNSEWASIDPKQASGV